MKLFSSFWDCIQTSLFPYLEEELGPLTEKQKKLITLLEIIRIEEYITDVPALRGRKKKDRKAFARAFAAKAVYNFNSTRELIDLLESVKNLRRICGWERKSQVPNESTFSRAFSEFASNKLPERVHEALIKENMSERIVGHVSRDSTEIEAREKPVVKQDNQPKPEQKRKPGRPRKKERSIPKEPTRIERQKSMSLEEMLNDLPNECDRGAKKNSKGYKMSWNGYKLHIDAADGQIPVSCVLTSASVHDSQVAIPLAAMSSERVTNLYDLMDSAYDCQSIKDFSIDLGHVPIIDSNPRRGIKEEMDPAKKIRYNERTNVERVNGRLKDEFGGRMIRVRGAEKVMAHLMFGILALTADQLLRLFM